ncbi:microtubule-associated protein Jupiter isoform X4 [Lucilia cuprina]|uniref:microtubule-associated protein Jupiter isoform X4 n=1 Tax=Lucilia cuprina TaxID=7375 RepID=UPI001F064B55|nr:microtubule-associated protein Jupiter isoform X4 [Lucilia cuprina]
MAAYAAFKHVELYNVGKTKKRVLRPPGGGTSDIFGGDLPQTPRSVKNHMQSNIFSCEKDSIKNNVRQGAHRFYFIGDQPRRAQKNVDSYQRLFGEPERPVTPAKNHMKSNIPFGAKNEAAQALIMNGNGNGHYNGKSGSVSSASSSVSSSTENLKMNGFSKTDGNPVTGEGYKSNDFNHTPSLNGANQVINKNRIPPGGFSSGLW